MMWRIVSLKSFVAIVILVFVMVLIMSRTTGRKSEFAEANKFKSPDFTAPESQENDVEMHYYSNNHNPHSQRREVPEQEVSKNQKVKEGPLPPVVVDYPFEDEENDFDPLSAPGEEDKKSQKINPHRRPAHTNNGEKSTLDSITCDVNNGKYVIDCKKSNDGDEVYVPFNFLQKYYEISGKMSETKADTFMWSHTPPIKIYRQKKQYDPKGVFAFFDNYNVEVRDRVKCISGSTGVPVSTQWDIHGYYYPIQIAQFGLSHYSKYVTEKGPTRLVLENGKDVRGKWIIHNLSEFRTVPDPENLGNHVVAIKATKGVIGMGNPSPGFVELSLQNVQRNLLILSFDIRSMSKLEVAEMKQSSSNVTITVKIRYEAQEFFLHYVTAEFYIKAQDNHIFHGLGYKSHDNWQHVIRDIGVDVQKGANFNVIGGSKRNKQTKIPRSKIILESISISNVNFYDAPLLIDNVTLSSTEHLKQFFQAVDWFVDNQDSRGGWPIPVSRKFNRASNFYPTLRPGWLSAMGQGHGLSLLTRAYAITHDQKYALACEKTLHTIFDHPGTDNLGVRATFLDEYVWYEEYPTTPSSFVLNGFMYALLGLYDVHMLRIPGAFDKARLLYNEGLRSLIKMLPLYDTGSGTFYDLRHFTVPGIAPNLARLDYHVTHINQLLIFASIHEDPIFQTTAARWIQYTEGVRAPHN